MRIISKFHDYYDPVMQYGMDKECVYERNYQEIILENEWFFSRRGPVEMTKERREIEEFGKNFQKNISTTIVDSRFYERKPTQFLGTESYGFILFCGEIHQFVQIALRENMNEFRHYTFSEEDIKKKVSQHDQDVIESYINEESCEFNKSGLFRYRSKYPKLYNSFFQQPTTKQYNELIDFHIKYQSPIILLEYMHNKIKLLINPDLSKYEFYKVFDSFSAFQKIYSFISGVLGNKEKETSDIGDNDLKEMKGFDDWSFKKEPTKKKRR